MREICPTSKLSEHAQMVWRVRGAGKKQNRSCTPSQWTADNKGKPSHRWAGKWFDLTGPLLWHLLHVSQVRASCLGYAFLLLIFTPYSIHRALNCEVNKSSVKVWTQNRVYWNKNYKIKPSKWVLINWCFRLSTLWEGTHFFTQVWPYESSVWTLLLFHCIPMINYNSTLALEIILFFSLQEELKMRHAVTFNDTYKELWSLVAMNTWFLRATGLVFALLYGWTNHCCDYRKSN